MSLVWFAAAIYLAGAVVGAIVATRCILDHVEEDGPPTLPEKAAVSVMALMVGACWLPLALGWLALRTVPGRPAKMHR